MSDALIEAIGYAAGGARMLSFVPQVLKTLRTRKADDLSLAMLLLNILTIALFIVYAYYKHLVPILITLSILLAMLALQTGLTLKYSERPFGRKSRPAA